MKLLVLSTHGCMQLLVLWSMPQPYSSLQGTSPSSSRKRVDLPLKDKIKLIKKSEQHRITQASVAKEFGVSTSQVSRLMKAKEDILKQFLLKKQRTLCSYFTTAS